MQDQTYQIVFLFTWYRSSDDNLFYSVILFDVERKCFRLKIQFKCDKIAQLFYTHFLPNYATKIFLKENSSMFFPKKKIKIIFSQFSHVSVLSLQTCGCKTKSRCHQIWERVSLEVFPSCSEFLEILFNIPQCVVCELLMASWRQNFLFVS